jgi:hypothetical protein
MSLFTDAPLIKVSDAYSAGVLKSGVLADGLEVTEIQVHDFIRDRYQLNKKTRKYELDTPNDKTERSIIFRNYEALTRVLLSCASSGGIDVEQAVNMLLDDRELFDRCFEAAISQNPSLSLVPDETKTAPNKKEAKAKNSTGPTS